MLRKIVNYFKAQLYKIFFQKKYTTLEGETIHYIFKKQTASNVLVVVFSGFSSHYKKARYNYIKSFKKIKINQLFILDDTGFMGGGSYYLGKNLTLFKQNAIGQLVQYIKQGREIYQTISFGSSKGGTCALLYGNMIGADIIISGSPQFYLGDYLTACEYHKNILNSIMENNANNVYLLNNIVLEELIKNKKRSNIYLIYSSKEGDYSKHILPLIKFLNTTGYDVSLYDCGFEEHSEIGTAMKRFIQIDLAKILEKSGK